jgi:AcrR family transcriptional regulator
MTPRPKESERASARAQTRQLLLQAAAEEFASEGYVGANINRISRAAGFAKGTIYNYFPSKRALMLALIDETAQTHADFIVAGVQEVDDPSERLTHFFEAGFDFVPSHFAQSRVMVNNIYGPDEEFKTRMFQAYQPLFQFVGKDIVAAGIAEGVFRPIDAESTAVLLMTIYLGTASQVSEGGQAWLDSGQVADFCLNAIASHQWQNGTSQ